MGLVDRHAAPTWTYAATRSRIHTYAQSCAHELGCSPHSYPQLGTRSTLRRFRQSGPPGSEHYPMTSRFVAARVVM